MSDKELIDICNECEHYEYINWVGAFCNAHEKVTINLITGGKEIQFCSDARKDNNKRCDSYIEKKMLTVGARKAIRLIKDIENRSRLSRFIDKGCDDFDLGVIKDILSTWKEQ